MMCNVFRRYDGMKTMLALKTADNNTFDAH